jgi:Tol biopolymer transport system component
MIYQLGSGQVRTLTDTPLVEDFSPAFSPNGVTLAFTRRFLDDERWTPGRQIWLMTMPAAGSDPSQIKPLTISPDYLYTALAWHPEGTKLAAVRFNVTLLTEPPEIWLLDLGGGAVRLVIGGFSPQWIP